MCHAILHELQNNNIVASLVPPPPPTSFAYVLATGHVVSQGQRGWLCETTGHDGFLSNSKIKRQLARQYSEVSISDPEIILKWW